MTLHEILKMLDDTSALIDSGRPAEAKAKIHALKVSLGGAVQHNVIPTDRTICPSCEKKTQGQQPHRWCSHCGWRE